MTSAEDDSKVMLDDPEPTKTQGLVVPDLVKIGALPSNTQMKVSTEISEPVVNTDKFARWTLACKGLLHSHSRIVLSTTADATRSLFYPVNIGVHSLISRAVLKAGTRTLCEVDDFNYLMAYQSMFVTSENNKEREQVISARCMAHESQYLDGIAYNTNTEAGGVQIDNGKMYNVKNNTSHEWQLNKNSPTFSVLLSDLFSFLKHNQLPLYMVDPSAPVTIELTFTEGASRICKTDGDTAFTPVIDTTQTKLVADYIFYDVADMEAHANANKTLTFDYVDYRLNKNSLSVAEARTQVSNLGGANRSVNKVIVGIQGDYGKQDKLCSLYNAVTPKLDGSGETGLTEMNIKYNDNYLYPINVKNSARHFHNLIQAEGKVPYVCRSEYNFQGLNGGVSDGLFNGLAMDNSLEGRFFWQAFKLNSGDKVNSRGIELTSKFVDLDATATSFTQRAWLELNKTAVLKDGFIESYYS